MTSETNPSNATRITREDFETLTLAAGSAGVSFGHVLGGAVFCRGFEPDQAGVLVVLDRDAERAEREDRFCLVRVTRNGTDDRWNFAWTRGGPISWGDAWGLLQLPEDAGGEVVTP